MASDFKPATDRSLADLNRANRDAWDSGEFRHGDAVDTSDIRHPWGGGQQVVGASGEVVVHAHDMHPSEELQRSPGGGYIIHGAKRQNSTQPANPQNRTKAGRRIKLLNEKNEPKKAEDRAVHLPRTAKRTWKNGVWS